MPNAVIVELDQPVMVTEGGGRDLAVLSGKVVKIGRVWIDVQFDLTNTVRRFRKDTQKTGSDIGYGSYFYTMEQWAERQRQIDAGRVLSDHGISLQRNSVWRGREAELAALLTAGPAAEQQQDEAVAVAVPQLNNGTPTLVVFAVPFAATRNRGGRRMTFDEASAVRLGPPSVLTKHDFDA